VRDLANIENVQSRFKQRVNTLAVGYGKADAGLFWLIEPIGKGTYPLVPDHSRRSSAETMIDLRLAWQAAPVMIYGEVLNLQDEDGNDIVYFHESSVAGFDPAGVAVEGRMAGRRT